MMIFPQMADSPLSSAELQQLNTLLTARGGLTIFETHGLLCAVVSGPNLLSPQQWLNAILGEEKEFNSMEEMQTLMGTIIKLNNQIAHELREQDTFVPLFSFDTTPLNSAIMTNEQKKNISLWCKGYLFGVSLDADGWKSTEKYEGDKKGIVMFLFSIVSLMRAGKNENFGLSNLDLKFEQAPSEQEIQTFLNSAIDMLPKTAYAIFNYWITQRPPQGFVKSAQSHSRSQKIGRNNPCVCGSGKKFKKCCADENTTLH